MSDWKVSRGEMLRLLGVGPSASPSAPEAPVVAPPAVPEPAISVPEQPHSEMPSSKPPRASTFTPAHFMLARALPRLWRFAQAQAKGPDARAQRRKLRELICWALTKEGFSVSTNAVTPYRQAGAAIAGRLELLVKTSEGKAVLAIETDWIGETSSLLKLEAAHRAGLQALWVLGRPCEADSLPKYRTLANRTLRQATGAWLAIYHLDHGWVRASASPVAK